MSNEVWAKKNRRKHGCIYETGYLACDMPLRGKKLGLLISVPPEHPNFNHGVRVAETALTHGLGVYLYCIDDAVKGLNDPRLLQLQAGGLKLFACAYGAQRRGLSPGEQVVLAGLTILNDLIAETDRFVSFN